MREYTKCGKWDCIGWSHGPYYYAYWKDENGKLKKKYIGKYLQGVKLIDNLKINDYLQDYFRFDT